MNTKQLPTDQTLLLIWHPDHPPKSGTPEVEALRNQGNIRNKERESHSHTQPHTSSWHTQPTHKHKPKEIIWKGVYLVAGHWKLCLVSGKAHHRTILLPSLPFWWPLRQWMIFLLGKGEALAQPLSTTLSFARGRAWRSVMGHSLYIPMWWVWPSRGMQRSHYMELFAKWPRPCVEGRKDRPGA